ncbi:hypothetical protein QUW40_07005 [Collinsella tanakaei]|uniref:hypothetical protein n=1 Tax=Collinsella tanakaei TaxID=626935 RepID=UPI0025A34879|nr:hypothetical protein [Collinsella tanakaei]MDM8246346.1 hypothetical protein [Collinsella tanakaei]
MRNDDAIRLQSAAAGGESGTLVLVRDESRTTEELIAALEADPRVAFAEPNYTWGARTTPVPPMVHLQRRQNPWPCDRPTSRRRT